MAEYSRSGFGVYFCWWQIFGPLLAPNVKIINLQNILQTPSANTCLGTDQTGAATFLFRLLAGIRTDLLIGNGRSRGVQLSPSAGRCWQHAGKRMNNWRGDTLERYRIAARDIICAFPWLVYFFS